MSEKQLHIGANEEEAIYKIWEARGYFGLDGNKAIRKEGKRFSIMMPPPNVTGSLHIGHALTYTLPDIMVRYKRMDGYETLWQPGTDHAGIATQNVVEKQLLAKGIKKEDIGREKFLEHVWAWKEESGSQIVYQQKKLGISPDWSRQRFTMDEGLKSSVRKAFAELYNKGLIVRGNYLVNWCTNDGALSDIEVEYDEENGKLYHIKYFLENSDEHIVVATTRPETYFGDTAVMVHPDDPRYRHLLGKKVVLPIIGKEVEVIADEHVDMEFGTGIVKVTPAHDTNDYEVGKRHNLKFLTIFDEKGILNEHCGEFEGLERLKARKVVVERLEAEGYIEKIEEHVHQVGHCYRCGNVIEPYISKQWFVKKETADKAIAAVNKGDSKFFPASWKNNYDAWMRELRDWCISRQLWWGHRIPVFYCEECGHEWASETEEEHTCPKCGSHNIYQDPDVLDTWFSSGLWPFSTLGWGNEENAMVRPDDLEKFYPNSLMITGFDILFFWVARMLMMGTELKGNIPFKDIYLHALVRDENGHKMSKSKGNVIDPLDMIEQYGADVLRFTLAVLAVQGRDIKLSRSHLELYGNFCNKLLNAGKYLLMKQPAHPDMGAIEVKTELGRYMQSRLALCTLEVREHIDQYRFNDAATTLYRFMWNEFCDWGIEFSKVDADSIPELGAVFKEALKLLHPFMPYFSEKLYHDLSGTTLENSDSIMVMPYPVNTTRDERIETSFERIMEAIIAIRRAKVPIDMANKTIAKACIKTDEQDLFNESYIKRLAKVETIEFVSEKPDNAVSDVSENMEVYIPTDSIDLGPILAKLEKQKEKLEKEAAKLNGMLSNEKFVANAPAEVVEENKKAFAELQERIAKVDSELTSLK